MRHKTAIDVFIPVYNDERYVARAINSCLEQEGVDVRVLVSDNCSTDNSYKIAQEIAECDPRVIVSQNEINIGMVSNLHRLNDLVERPFYMFLCSDDYLLDRSAFASALDLFEKYDDLVSVYSNIDFLDPNGKLIARNRFDRNEIFDPKVTMRRSLITTRNRFGIPILHRSEFGKQHSFLENTKYSSDLWHSFKVGENGRCGHINRACIGNTYTGDNLTRSLMRDALSELKYLAKLENIELTPFENLCQLGNYFKTLCAKYMFFRFLLPLKTRLNAAT